MVGKKEFSTFTQELMAEEFGLPECGGGVVVCWSVGGR